MAAVILAVIIAATILILLFQPGLRYKLSNIPEPPLASDEYAQLLESLADAKLQKNSSIDVIPNGEHFYPAELEAIRSAQKNINMEAYIFERGELTKQFVDAMTERAHAGVKVRLTIDAMGSFSMSKQYFQSLTDAGGHVEWYHPVRWYSLPRINNRTHREILIVDGRVAFVGGAGIADHWLKTEKDKPRWRDTMFRVRGEAVQGLQATFIENWLNSSGELLSGMEYFPQPENQGPVKALVVNSMPSMGGSTRARILFQTLLASAKKSIYITTPYFLPDKSAIGEMVRAMKERNVEIRIITPGRRSDHGMTRSSSRGLYGELLQAGAKIAEYQPAMIHQKMLVVDGVWSVVGSTNFDNRSFGLNDEVNVAARDTTLAQELIRLFEEDWQKSHAVGYQEWQHRPVWERFVEMFGWILQRQQ
ncbi:MAG TPA: phospholipase D-like domain-containing protein [Terriglobales bacterium]